MKMNYLACFLTIIFVSSILYMLPIQSSFALMDYSDANKEDSGGISVRIKDQMEEKKNQEGNRPTKGPSSYSNSNETSGVPSQMSLKMIDIGTLYESMDVKQVQKDKDNTQTAKVDLMRFRAFLQTPYNVFLDTSYYMAKSDSDWISPQKKSFQQGNPRVALGFNWLKLGSISERAQFDIYAGMSVKTKNSDFGSSRNDQYGGIRTTKNFHYFVIGLVGELSMLGTPSNHKEAALGNMSRLGGALAWVVSTDITLEIEAYRYQISPYGKSGYSGEKLDHSITFSGASPKLLLGLSSNIELMLGGTFKTKNIMPSDQRLLVSAKLYDVLGAYGNSIFAGLDFSL